MFSGRELRAHLEDDRRAQDNIDRKLDAIRSETRTEFDKVRSEVDRRHNENQHGIDNIKSMLLKAAGALLLAIAVQYFAAHGFRVAALDTTQTVVDHRAR